MKHLRKKNPFSPDHKMQYGQSIHISINTLLSHPSFDVHYSLIPLTAKNPSKHTNKTSKWLSLGICQRPPAMIVCLFYRRWTSSTNQNLWRLWGHCVPRAVGQMEVPASQQMTRGLRLSLTSQHTFTVPHHTFDTCVGATKQHIYKLFHFLGGLN